MKDALKKLQQEIYSQGSREQLDDAAWSAFTQNCVVALMAGGEGSRFKTISDSHHVQKNSVTLPNGDTMIERTIRMYRDAGFKNFAALVFHNADSIINLLGDGSRLGISITYSRDPKQPVGKGGAMRHALENGSIALDRSCIVHNPDDQIINYDGDFVRDAVAAHLAGTRRGMIATSVVADGSPYAFTGMKIKDGVVVQTEMYPHIPVPAHIGVTLFSPAAYEYFPRLFDLNKKIDFESVLFPLLVEERKLYSFGIPGQCWLAVNDQKALTKLIQSL
ncbi:MAG: hypothetical protein HY617_01135 [Candidatus Sungbacteria bacterium]|nr:hypothetical protein [Candidatus Sungbacteria bacterium]